MLFPLLSGALQISLTAGWCHCNHTCEDLLFMQVCSGLSPLHCSTALGKMLFPLLSGALQNSLTALTSYQRSGIWLHGMDSLQLLHLV